VFYYPLSFICSPCGKKFRSKPQIARFLGDHVDLSVFDFSRGALTGSSGAQHRRARDRHVRRPYDGKGSTSLSKPFTGRPLGASGPIRRTCGVIKLPVVRIPEPSQQRLELAAADNCEPEPEPMDTSEARSAAPTPPTLAHSRMNGSVSPRPPENQVGNKSPRMATKSPSPIPQLSATSNGGQGISKSRSPSAPALSPPPFSAPIPSTTTSATLITLSVSSYRRLRGYTVHDQISKTEIQVDQEWARHGVAQPSVSLSEGEASNGVRTNVENSGVKTGSGESKATTSSGGIKLPQTTVLNNLLAKQNVITSSAISSGQSGVISVVPSLLAHGIKGHGKPVGSGTTAGGVLSAGGGGVSAKFSSIKSGMMSNQPNRTNITSGNLILTLPTISQGAIKMIKQAAAVDTKKVSGTMVTGQKQALRTAVPVLTSSSRPVNSLLSSTSGSGSKQDVLVSQSELVEQEEKVRKFAGFESSLWLHRGQHEIFISDPVNKILQ